MKKFKLILLSQILTLTAMAGITEDNYLHLADIEINPGETQEVELLMTNSDVVAAIQGNMKLPEGLSFVIKNNGRLDVKNIDERAEDFTLSCAIQADGSMTFAQYSADGFTYEGNSGGIFKFKIKAADDATPGTYEITLTDMVLSIGGVGYDIPSHTSSLTIIGAVVVPEITADNKEREYGEENPQLTYTATEELNGVPELSTTATNTSAVGTYDIVVERGTLVGDFVAHNGVLTVTKAPLIISAESYSITQGEELPVFEVTYSGFKNDETSEVLLTQPTVSTTATSESAPGTYDIIVTGASAENYDISYVTGTLTILEGTDINGVSFENKNITSYSIDGQLLNTPRKGVNVIRGSDGTVKKVLK